MEDEAILLKIKRQFEKDEATVVLLKIIEELRVEIGVLKSDLSEKNFELNKVRNSVKLEGLKTKKEWLKDDLINEMTNQINNHQERNKEIQKYLSEWQEKYFRLYNSLPESMK